MREFEFRERQDSKEEKPIFALLNMGFSIIIPVAILMKLSGPEYLGPFWALLSALFFPISWGGYDLLSNKKWNAMSILGLVSVLLTGGLALLKFDGVWFAVKEAAIPLVIGIYVLYTTWTKHSIVQKFLLNPKLMDLDKIEAALDSSSARISMQRLMIKTTYLVASSFLLSAILNFVLAIWLLKSPTGTPQFNEELGRMTALSFPVIMVPCMIVLLVSLWYLIHGIKLVTGLTVNQILREQ